MRVTAFYLKSVTKRGNSNSVRGRGKKREIERGTKRRQSITKIFITKPKKKNFFRRSHDTEKIVKAMFESDGSLS